MVRLISGCKQTPKLMITSISENVEDDSRGEYDLQISDIALMYFRYKDGIIGALKGIRSCIFTAEQPLPTPVFSVGMR